ncbi:hypothetical protein B0H17DRAFT_931845, partial [Mycena rosella]
FIERIQETGATPAEADEYTQQARTRLDAASGPQPPPPPPSQHPSREGTPVGLSEADAIKFRSERDTLIAAARSREEENRRTNAEEIEWSVLRSKISSLFPGRQPSRSSLTATELEKFLGLHLSNSSSPTSIPAATLLAAPHLARLTAGINADPHMEETWKLRKAYGSDKALDPIVDVMQLQDLVDPLPRSIWKCIIQDHYVDFEKVFAAMDSGYDHHDDPKEFAGGFSLVKKDAASAKRTIRSESDWLRVFAAWRVGVSLLYPHRNAELSGYLKLVTDLFRAAPSEPLVAIRFDVEAREKYAKSPFHMDDRSYLNTALLSQMFRHPPASGSVSKRATPSGPAPGSSKRAAVPCQNWNLGFCTEPCSNRRMHGSCSECGKPHRAKDVDKCHTALTTRRRKGSSGDNSAGESSGSRA